MSVLKDLIGGTLVVGGGLEAGVGVDVVGELVGEIGFEDVVVGVVEELVAGGLNGWR